MGRDRVLAGVVVACIALSGCASSFRRSYPMATDTASEHCRVAFKQQYPVTPDEVALLGTVTAKDTGFSVTCDEAYVLRRMRDDACALGADVVSLSDEQEPDFWNTCYRAKGELLRFRDRAAAKTARSDARYDTAPLRKRSEVTYERQRDMMVWATLGGVAGAAAGAAIVPCH